MSYTCVSSIDLTVLSDCAESAWRPGISEAANGEPHPVMGRPQRKRAQFVISAADYVSTCSNWLPEFSELVPENVDAGTCNRTGISRIGCCGAAILISQWHVHFDVVITASSIHVLYKLLPWTVSASDAVGVCSETQIGLKGES